MGLELFCECGVMKENIFFDTCFTCEIFKTLKSKEKPTSFTCYKCLKSYSSLQSRNRHMQSHDKFKKYRCTFKGCSVSCYDSCKLKLHMHTHMGHKAFGCEQCEKSFSTKWNRTAHVKRFH